MVDHSLIVELVEMVLIKSGLKQLLMRTMLSLKVLLRLSRAMGFCYRGIFWFRRELVDLELV